MWKRAQPFAHADTTGWTWGTRRLWFAHSCGSRNHSAVITEHSRHAALMRNDSVGRRKLVAVNRLVRDLALAYGDGFFVSHASHPLPIAPGSSAEVNFLQWIHCFGQ